MDHQARLIPSWVPCPNPAVPLTRPSSQPSAHFPHRSVRDPRGFLPGRFSNAGCCRISAQRSAATRIRKPSPQRAFRRGIKGVSPPRLVMPKACLWHGFAPGLSAAPLSRKAHSRNIIRAGGAATEAEWEQSAPAGGNRPECPARIFSSVRRHPVDHPRCCSAFSARVSQSSSARASADCRATSASVALANLAGSRVKSCGSARTVSSRC